MLALVAALALAAAAPPAATAAPAAPVTTASPAAPDGAGAERPKPKTSVIVLPQHDLSDSNGLIPLTWANLAADRGSGEFFVVAEGFVRIFNSVGMESFRFGDDGSLGQVERLAVLDDGSLIVLSVLNGARVFLHCDYRGDLIARWAMSGVPDGFEDFTPDALVYRNGRLYFAEKSRMRVVVTDVDGVYRQSYQLAPLVTGLIQNDPERKSRGSMDGFGVDPQGRLLFTSSIMFAAGVVSPSGELKLFGSRGSTPGRFNNVGGIDADEKGNIYVTDRLRAVVSIWSPELKHLGEFGYRGYGPSNLIAPWEIVIAGDRVAVSQAANRGVKVYRVRLVQSVVDVETKPEGDEPPAKPSPGSAGGGK
jgi:hypothetical protein